MEYNEILEFVAENQHVAWIHWSKYTAERLKSISKVLTGNFNPDIKKSKEIIDSLVLKWEKNWIPYTQLSEEEKEKDREWAMEIIDFVPNRCPINQCSGIMKTIERDPPKDLKGVEKDAHYQYNGDWQSPDLVCTNCGAVYQFKRFRKLK